MRMNVRSIPGSKNRKNNATGAGWKYSQDGRTAQVKTARLLHLHRHFLCVRIILCDVNEWTGGKIATERLCRIAQLRGVALHDKTRQARVTWRQKHSNFSNIRMTLWGSYSPYSISDIVRSFIDDVTIWKTSWVAALQLNYRKPWRRKSLKYLKINRLCR